MNIDLKYFASQKETKDFTISMCNDTIVIVSPCLRLYGDRNDIAYTNTEKVIKDKVSSIIFNYNDNLNPELYLVDFANYSIIITINDETVTTDWLDHILKAIYDWFFKSICSGDDVFMASVDSHSITQTHYRLIDLKNNESFHQIDNVYSNFDTRLFKDDNGKIWCNIYLANIVKELLLKNYEIEKFDIGYFKLKTNERIHVFPYDRNGWVRFMNIQTGKYHVLVGYDHIHYARNIAEYSRIIAELMYIHDINDLLRSFPDMRY